MSFTLRPNPSGDTLVASRDPIRTNFNVIQTRWETNHGLINDSTNGGKHLIVVMPERSLAEVPSTDPNEGALYTKDVSGETQLFFRRENDGTEVQITSGTTANAATFGTNTAYVANHEGGWTYLPGGLIMQYGRFLTTIIGNNVITYPIAFGTATYSVVAVLEGTRAESSVRTLTTTSFTFSSAVSNQNVDWMAIGK